MHSIRRRLKELSKTFPPLKDAGPERLQAAALAHLSVQDLYLLRTINDKLERSPVSSLSEPELLALEAYYNAFDLTSRQARPLKMNSSETRDDVSTQKQNRATRTSRDA